MNREDFLEKCNEHEMFIEKMWDLGAIVNSERCEEGWFEDLCSYDWWNCPHSSMSFINLSDIDELEDADNKDVAMAMFNQIIAHNKFGYIAQINIPVRTYLGKDTYSSGGMYSVPVFYGDRIEDIWQHAAEFADEQRAKEKAKFEGKKQLKEMENE